MSGSKASTSLTRKEYSNENYTVGIICALPIELAAAVKMLDEEHPRLAQNQGDDNSYRLGRIGGHKVVIGCLAAGRTGLVSAATVALKMKSSFIYLRFGLMVGIGGGVPSEEHDVRLGDVVVSKPTGQHGGVVQYDLGKTRPNGNFERTGSLSPPPDALLTTLTDVMAAQEMDELNIAAHLSELAHKLPAYGFPAKLTDDLYPPSHLHKGGKTCFDCGKENLVQREDRPNKVPAIHYGTIASGNRVMKDAVERDFISQALGGVLCFEMEAAGLMNNFPCLVIRGISDYSDSHKNDGWQRYAAATAAAFAKELLNHLAPTTVAQTQTISQAMDQLTWQLARNSDVTQQTYRGLERAAEQNILEWLWPSSDFSKIQNEIRHCRVKDTGDWLIQDLEGLDWYRSGRLVWIHGVAGCGKTVLSSKIIDHLIQRCKSRAGSRVAYWYFQFSSVSTQDISCMLRSILRQLMCSPLPDKVQELWNFHHRHGTEPSHSELLDTISDLIAVHGEIFLVFDALDEYPENKSPGRSILLETIEQLRTLNQERTHLIVTSRREPDIRKMLQPVAYRSINVDRALESDVEKFVDHALSHESIKRWGAELISLATEKLLQSEERRFRWTDLQIKRLSACVTADDFRDALNTIPNTLEETYHQALETIPRNHQKHVRQVLIWLTSSFRELTSSEVAAAVSFPFVEDVLRICTSVLITVIDGDTRETIKLAHFTVKEFLIIREGCEEGLHWYRFTARLANRCIATQAIETVFEHVPAESRNLLKYASQFWPAHARRNDVVPISTASDELLSKINSLFETENLKSLLTWLLAQYPNETARSQASMSPQPLYFASLLGLKRSVAQLWHSCSQLDQYKGFYGNALNAAACMGHADVVMWLVGHIDNPPDYFDLSQIVRYLQVDVAQTLHALLRKGTKIVISADVLYSMKRNPIGQEILRICLEEDLATISITEELIKTATQDKPSREIVEVLVSNRARDFPATFWILHTIAKVSLSALQMLVGSGKNNIHLDAQDYLALAQEKSADITQKLLDLGVAIPVTTDLINALASSSSGSEILKLLLDTQTIQHPLTKSDVLTVAKGFNLETFVSLLRHDWEDNALTEELVLAIAFNCYLEPPFAAKIPARELRANGSVHRIYRPTLKQSTENDSSRALIALINKQDIKVDLTERIVAQVSDEFTRDVMLHLLNKLVGESMCGSDASACDSHRFSTLLWRHASKIGSSTTVLLALEKGYKLMSTRHTNVYERLVRSKAATGPSTDTTVPLESHRAARLLGLSSLPEALRWLEYSTSEYEEERVVYVQRGWRLPGRSISKDERSREGSRTSEDDFKAHQEERLYICFYCPQGFQSEDYVKQHQDHQHSRLHSWPCPALATVETAFHKPSTMDNETEICVYCHDQFANTADRLEHVVRTHRFGHCNQKGKIYSANRFRDHLEHSHAVTSASCIESLERSYMQDEPPPPVGRPLSNHECERVWKCAEANPMLTQIELASLLVLDQSIVANALRRKEQDLDYVE
ncbi:pfs domain-containing protein, partial [Aureobasidium melanogenum]